MSTNQTSKPPWKRISVEIFVIVASILLAFAIDAWWQDRERSRDEVESIELIQRDLLESINQLETHFGIAEAAEQAAVNAYKALSGPGPYEQDRIKTELLRVDRVTLRMPRAAYTELLSAAQLGVIDDRALRDEIVQFYETVERSELILEKNNSVFLDDFVMGALYREGLIYPYTNDEMLGDAVNAGYATVQDKFDEDFVHLPDPLWSLPPNSREWDKLRSILLNAAQIHAISQVTVRQLKTRAEALKASIDQWLANR